MYCNLLVLKLGKKPNSNSSVSHFWDTTYQLRNND